MGIRQERRFKRLAETLGFEYRDRQFTQKRHPGVALDLPNVAVTALISVRELSWKDRLLHVRSWGARTKQVVFVTLVDQRTGQQLSAESDAKHQDAARELTVLVANEQVRKQRGLA